jgi:AraC-like DNA-binding protein
MLQSESGTKTMGHQEDVIIRAIRFIEANMKEDIHVVDLATEVSYSEFHFSRLFMEITGETPGAYLRKRRLEKAAAEIMAGREIIDTAIDYGFHTQGTFTRSFKTHFGTTPGTYKMSGLNLRSSTLNKVKEVELSRKSDKSLHYLDWVPVIREKGNELARGLETILNYLGDHTDYDTIMGDSGQAFVTQGEENSVNLIDGAVDVGWWPLHPLTLIRLNFLEKTVGRELYDVYPVLWGGENLADAYRQWFSPMVKSSIADNKPCLAWVCAPVASWIVITGYDDNEPPLFGECLDEGVAKIARIKDGWPSVLLAPGEPVEKIDRKEADFEALKYAIELHHDRVLGINVKYSGKYPLRDAEKFSKHWRTGLKTFSAWTKCLKDIDHPGQYYYHNNVLFHLWLSRSSAVRYLEAMRKRHLKDIANCIENAILKYKNIIDLLEKVDWDAGAMSSVERRDALISQIENIVNLESRAVAELEQAVELMD